MEPFFTSCTTCKARLKVRSEEAIGQILPCPKCRSMVMILPPTEADREAPPPEPQKQIAPQAAASAFEYVDEALADEPSSPSVPMPWLGNEQPIDEQEFTESEPQETETESRSSETAEEPTFENALSELAGAEATPDFATKETVVDDNSLTETSIELGDEPLADESPAKESTVSEPVVSDLTTIDLTAIDQTTSGEETIKNPTDTVPEEESSLEQVTPIDEETSVDFKEAIDSTIEEELLPPVDDTTELRDDLATNDKQEPENVSFAEEPLIAGDQWRGTGSALRQKLLVFGLIGLFAAVSFGFAGHTIWKYVTSPKKSQPIVAGPSPQDTDTSPNEEDEYTLSGSSSPATNQDSGSDVSSIDSEPGVDGLDIDTAENLADEDQPAIENIAEDQPADQFGDNSNDDVVEIPAEENSPAETVAINEASSEAQLDVDPIESAEVPDDETTAEPVITLKPPLPPIDIEARLSIPISDVEFDDIALVDFTRFITEMTTVPVTIDPGALDLVRKTADSRITIAKKQTTARELLRVGLARARLHLQIQDGNAIATRLGKNNSQLRDFEHRLSDFATEGPVDLIAGWIEQMVAPNSWKARGGQGNWKLRNQSLMAFQTPTNHFRILSFAETLRTARGRSPRGKGYQPTRFRLETRTSRAASALNSTVRLGSVRPTTFIQHVLSLEQQAGVRILVDWRHLASVGVAPTMMDELQIQSVVLADGLNTWLKPLGLTFVAVNERTLRITSQRNARLEPEVEFYHLRDDLQKQVTVDGLVQRIRTEVGEKFLKLPAANEPSNGAIAYDEVSGTLIVSLPQEQQRVVEDVVKALD